MKELRRRIKENKMIGEFMGMQHTDIGWYDNDETLQLQNNTFDELQYHTSWDWLIPVVQKIGEDFNVAIYDNDGIEKVYKRVVEFIKNK